MLFFRFRNKTIKMRLLTAFATLAFLCITYSCKKDTVPPVTRTIQYILYTDKDFSSDDALVTFTLYMKNRTNIIFDSSLAPMKLKDIPNAANKIVFEKTVPHNDTALLTVGFLYSIEGVGNSWYLDTCASGETFKTVNYNFQ